MSTNLAQFVRLSRNNCIENIKLSILNSEVLLFIHLLQAPADLRKFIAEPKFGQSKPCEWRTPGGWLHSPGRELGLSRVGGIIT